MLLRLRGSLLLTALMLVAGALPGATSAASAPASPLAATRWLPPQEPALVTPAIQAPLRAARYPPQDDGVVERIVPAAARPLPPSVFAGSQVIALYGYPGVPGMGALGAYTPEQAGDEALRVAARYDALNGEQGAVGALELIVAVAQPTPESDGSYLARLPAATVQRYVEVARERGLLLFLDVQIGWADPLREVQRLEPMLAEPFVHLALDPEFATAGTAVPPGIAIGSLDGDAVNAVQRYLAALVREHHLPPKVLVLHQFLDSMLTGTAQYEAVDDVEITIDMDGFGSDHVKLANYDRYALASYAERPALKLFYTWDVPLLTPARVLGLERPPALVIYQ